MKVCILGGSGYVGLVTGAGLSELGHEVICVDIDKNKVEGLNYGIMPIEEEGLKEMVCKNLENGRLRFTTVPRQGIDKADVIFITVGTPESEDGSADLKYVLSTAEDIALYISEYSVIAVKSTVPVGTCDKVREVISSNIKDRNIYFDVVSNPEFLREGSAVKDFFNPDRIVVGSESIRAVGVMKQLYKSFDCPVVITSRRSAEIIKYAANTYLATRLSFINEIAEVCEKTGGDINDVALGIGFDKRIGSSYLKPGIGFGGPCLVKDLKALIHISNESGCSSSLLQSVLDRNYMQSENFIKKLKSIYGNLNKRSIFIAGLSFKPGTDDIRNAPSLNLISRLHSEKASITVYDPLVMKLPEPYNSMVAYADDVENSIKGKEVLMFVTEWPEFNNLNFNKIRMLMKSPVVIDGRNMFEYSKMMKLGLDYICIGRESGSESYEGEEVV